MGGEIEPQRPALDDPTPQEIPQIGEDLLLPPGFVLDVAAIEIGDEIQDVVVAALHIASIRRCSARRAGSPSVPDEGDGNSPSLSGPSSEAPSEPESAL